MSLSPIGSSRQWGPQIEIPYPGMFWTDYTGDADVNASVILRRLKDLDQLEKRLKELVNPSPILLANIATERQKLLTGEVNDEKIPRK